MTMGAYNDCSGDVPVMPRRCHIRITVGIIASTAAAPVTASTAAFASLVVRGLGHGHGDLPGDEQSGQCNERCPQSREVCIARPNQVITSTENAPSRVAKLDRWVARWVLATPLGHERIARQADVNACRHRHPDPPVGAKEGAVDIVAESFDEGAYSWARLAGVPLRKSSGCAALAARYV